MHIFSAFKSPPQADTKTPGPSSSNSQLNAIGVVDDFVANYPRAPAPDVGPGGRAVPPSTQKGLARSLGLTALSGGVAVAGAAICLPLAALGVTGVGLFGASSIAKISHAAAVKDARRITNTIFDALEVHGMMNAGHPCPDFTLRMFLEVVPEECVLALGGGAAVERVVQVICTDLDGRVTDIRDRTETEIYFILRQNVRDADIGEANVMAATTRDATNSIVRALVHNGFLDANRVYHPAMLCDRGFERFCALRSADALEFLTASLNSLSVIEQPLDQEQRIAHLSRIVERLVIEPFLPDRQADGSPLAGERYAGEWRLYADRSQRIPWRRLAGNNLPVTVRAYRDAMNLWLIGPRHYGRDGSIFYFPATRLGQSGKSSPAPLVAKLLSDPNDTCALMAVRRAAETHSSNTGYRHDFHDAFFAGTFSTRFEANFRGIARCAEDVSLPLDLAARWFISNTAEHLRRIHAAGFVHNNITQDSCFLYVPRHVARGEPEACKSEFVIDAFRNSRGVSERAASVPFGFGAPSAYLRRSNRTANDWWSLAMVTLTLLKKGEVEAINAFHEARCREDWSRGQSRARAKFWYQYVRQTLRGKSAPEGAIASESWVAELHRWRNGFEKSALSADVRQTLSVFVDARSSQEAYDASRRLKITSAQVDSLTPFIKGLCRHRKHERGHGELLDIVEQLPTLVWEHGVDEDGEEG